MKNTTILLFGVIAVSLGAVGASAELVTLSSGRTIKATDVVVEDDSVRLLLSFGAVMELPLEVVDRIVDDEVEDLEPVEIHVSGERLHRFDPSRGPLFDTAWNEWIIHIGREYDVDAALISAVIKAESDYDPRVISHKGAIGLMQLMPATATRFGVSDPHDPIQNLRGGVQYLSWLIDRFDGSIDLVLAGYNAGEGNVRKYEGVPPFRETRNYIRKISGYLGG